MKIELQKQTIDIICRALIAIVTALRKEYGLPEYHGVTVELKNVTQVNPPVYEPFPEDGV